MSLFTRFRIGVCGLVALAVFLWSLLATTFGPFPPVTIVIAPTVAFALFWLILTVANWMLGDN